MPGLRRLPADLLCIKKAIMADPAKSFSYNYFRVQDYARSTCFALFWCGYVTMIVLCRNVFLCRGCCINRRCSPPSMGAVTFLYRAGITTSSGIMPQVAR